MIKKSIILAICVLLSLSTTAQETVKGIAKQNYDKYEYALVIKKLLPQAEKGNVSYDLLEKLSNAYYYNGKMAEANRWINEIFEHYQEVDPELYFKQAIALKTIGNYDASQEAMQKFATLWPNDSRAKRFITSGNYLEIIKGVSEDYELENLTAINTTLSDFGTSLYKGNLVYASSNVKNGKVYKWNNQPFLDIFALSENANENAFEEVNTKYHESSTAFTADGNTMYFTRNNFINNKLRGDSNKTYKLKIFRASLINGKWTDIRELPFNSDHYNVAHPALSPDGKTLYFSSDMPGTLGASDIFKVDIYENGEYGTPENLGNIINTEARENFPFIGEDNTLYFSSNGHPGLGGLDVFKLDENQIKNLGTPINSSYDDFGYVINDETRKGYITSNRPGGAGDDDIYTFIRPKCVQEILGTTRDNLGTILSNVNISLNKNDVEIDTLISDAQGNFKYTFDCEESTYQFTGAKDGYNDGRQSLDLRAIKKTSTVTEVTLILNKPEPKPQAAAVGTDLFKLLNLKPIYFDYDKSYIRPDAEIELAKIIAYMQEFPNVKVDVRSHTDSRGRDAYNLALSQRRNASTLKYLVEKGNIQASRLSGKGYGETQLTNECGNGVQCSKEDHQANRRSEFIVIEN